MKNAISHIIEIIDKELEATGKEYISAVDANKLLEEKGILNDSNNRPGLPLRKLLRENEISHAYKVSGKWRIPHSKKMTEIIEKEIIENNVIDIPKKKKKNYFSLIMGCLLTIPFIIIIYALFTNESGKEHLKEIIPEIQYDSTIQNGYVKNYYQPINIVASEGKNKNGKKDSIWIYYDSKGIITEKYSYRNGLKDGPFEIFDSTGTNCLCKGFCKNDKFDGVVYVFWDDGKTINDKVIFINGLKEGSYVKYFSNGKTVELKGQYIHDNKTGKFIKYFENGKICEITTYKDNLKNGKYESFEYDDDLNRYYKTSEGNYKNDLETGEWRYYDYNDDNTKLILTFLKTFKDGEFNGRYIEYQQQYGFKLMERHYQNGLLDGTLKGYCPHGPDKGKLWFIEYYKNDERVSKESHLCNCYWEQR